MQQQPLRPPLLRVRHDQLDLSGVRLHFRCSELFGKSDIVGID